MRFAAGEVSLAAGGGGTLAGGVRTRGAVCPGEGGATIPGKCAGEAVRGTKVWGARPGEWRGVGGRGRAVARRRGAKADDDAAAVSASMVAGEGAGAHGPGAGVVRGAGQGDEDGP